MILAEISDKVPALAEVATIAIVIAIVAFLVGRIRTWLVLLPLPLVILGNWGTMTELSDESFRRAVETELGMNYILFDLAIWNIPYIIALASILLLKWWMVGEPQAQVTGN
ncbi:MAG: hypothetical protein FWD53_04105 [Phycisphaerales bacterium]|nr:hypothetical protein [Phycisphaerales bacterium]